MCKVLRFIPDYEPRPDWLGAAAAAPNMPGPIRFQEKTGSRMVNQGFLELESFDPWVP